MSLRVLHLAPLWHPIRRDAHGGIETFLYELIGGLDELGFQNTLIASGDSQPSCRLISAVTTNLVEQMRFGSAFEYCWYEQELLSLALEHADDYDVVHSHLTPGVYSLSSIQGIGQKILHTLHSPVHPDIKWFFIRHPEVWLTTVSKFQLAELGTPSPNWRVIPNGLPVNRFNYEPHPGDALMFMGRIEEQKGADLAVSVARELGQGLTLAGPILDETLFASKIEPYLDENIRYLGVLDHQEKKTRLANSSCVLMPSRWNEPFGMVAIEAMACGTPVVGLANGALPDIIEDGLTGYVTTDQQQLPELVQAAQCLDRSIVRARALARFDIHGVAANYASLYEEIHRSYAF
jgi:glycosyltransferase involved in cell wall biosynthesis